MGLDDFIDLDANNHECKDSDLHTADFRLSETDCSASTPQMKEGFPGSSNAETLEGGNGEEDGQHVQDMDLEDDLVPFTAKKGDLIRNEPIHESTRLVATAVTMEKVNEVEPDKENSCAVPLNDIKSYNLLIDEGRIL